MDITQFGLAFLEGFALIISPCILPILPIVLASSIEGGMRRPLGIIVGFVSMFSIFTFFSRKLVLYSGINLTVVRDVSFVLLILFGLIMMSTYLTEKFERLTQPLANVGSAYQGQGGFLSGILVGGLVGLVWTPCAGPILAAVIVQTVLQTTTASSFFIILAFGIGAAIPMLLIAMFGRTILHKMSFFQQHAVLIRKILGLIIILTVLGMIYFI